MKQQILQNTNIKMNVTDKIGSICHKEKHKRHLRTKCIKINNTHNKILLFHKALSKHIINIKQRVMDGCNACVAKVETVIGK